MMTNVDLANWFDKSWREDTYSPPWSKAVQGLTPEQAAWKPDGAKHSIWQIVMHMSFWREYMLRELEGEERDEEEIARRNWPEPEDISEAAWQAAVDRLVETQAQITAAIRESEEKAATLRNFIEHASYHMGQIMLLRAMQGLPPLDSFG